ncbi:MAG: 6-phosphofructokinase [Ignavibacteria bacterium]
MKLKIGVLTSGGDCPGLNAVLRGIVRKSNENNHTIIGILTDGKVSLKRIIWCLVIKKFREF